MTTAWDAGLYLQYADERTQPARDLLARVAIGQPARVIDIGCGPGNSTALLRQRWPEAEVVGLDNSSEMIAAAARDCPSGVWVRADADAWVADRAFDVVFSNATLHWLPDHGHLIPHLFAQVAERGALALQIPSDPQSPMRRLLIDVADDPSWRDRMNGPLASQTRESPSFYYDALSPLANHIDIWETEYCHIMDGPDAILTWIRGTVLRPYLAVLRNEERPRFEQRLLKGLAEVYPRRANGRVLFPFRRLFVIAYQETRSMILK